MPILVFIDFLSIFERRRDTVWDHFLFKNRLFTKTCIPKACFFVECCFDRVLVRFFIDFRHPVTMTTPILFERGTKINKSFPGMGFGSHFGSLLLFLGFTLADFCHLMAILALPLRHVDFLCFLDGFLNPPQGHRTAKV